MIKVILIYSPKMSLNINKNFKDIYI